MQSNTSEVENCFDSICAPAKRKPVFVEKSDQIDTVILSTDHYRALQVTPNSTSMAARKKEFEAEFGDWIAAQNNLVEKNGIPGADMRPW